MRRNFYGGVATLSISLMLMTGCAKDQVKPDEGMAPEKTVAQTQQSADQAAAEKAKAAQLIAEQQAAAKREAEKQAAIKAEQLKEQQAMSDESAGLMRPDQSAATESTSEAASATSAEIVKKALAMIHFDFDSYALSQASRDTLYNDAEYLLKKYQGKVRLEGHSDERGSDEYNLALGENRAKAAMNYLITLGVPADRLSIISYGKERPLVDEHNEEAWAMNRRVEFEAVK